MIKVLFRNEWQRQWPLLAVTALLSVIAWMTIFALIVENVRPDATDTWADGLLFFLPLFAVAVLTYRTPPAPVVNPFCPPNRLYWSRYLCSLLPVAALTLFDWAVWALLGYWQMRQHPAADGLAGTMLATVMLDHGLTFAAALPGWGAVAGLLGPVAAILLWTLWIPAVALWRLSMTGGGWSVNAGLLIVFTLWFGWYVGVRLLAFRRPGLKPPLMIIAAVMLLTPWLLCGIAHGYAATRYFLTERSAARAGLITAKPSSVSPSDPLLERARPWLEKFEPEWQSTLETNQFLIDHWNNLVQGATSAAEQRYNCREIGDDLRWLTQPDHVRVLDGMLKQILWKQPPAAMAEFYHGSPYRDDASDNDPCPVDAVRDYLSYQAVAAGARGRTLDFFRTLAQLRRMASLYLLPPYDRSEAGDTLQTLYQLAIAAGPDRPDALKYYRRMLADLKITGMPLPDRLEPETLKAPLHRQTFLTGLLERPRSMLKLAVPLRRALAEDALLQSAKHAYSLMEIEMDYRRLHLPGLEEALPVYLCGSDHPNRVYRYFYFRTMVDACRLGLALRIYHLEYGCWPESLAALTPKILRTLPLDSLTGKDFVYRRDQGGFMIEQRSNVNFAERYMAYFPWPAP